MGHVILRDLLIILAVAVPSVLIAHRLRLPSIVGFLITGAIIGPNALGLIPDIAEIRLLAEVGVALLLFSIGLEFSFDRLRGWGHQAIGMGSLQILLTIGAGFGLGWVFGRSMAESLILGCAIALSSTAIVLSILSQRRWYDSPAGRLSTGMLILQDLAVVPMMVGLSIAGDATVMNTAQTVQIAALKLALLAVVFLLARWLLSPLLRFIARSGSKELFVVAIVMIAIGAGYASDRAGISFAIGAFLAGILVSTTDFRFQALSEIAPFRYCFSGLFFVAVGMIVDPVFMVHNALYVGALIGFILIVKALIVGGCVVIFGYPLSVATIGGLMLAQVGEFSFLFVFSARMLGLLNAELYQLIVAASVVTMLVAPLLMSLAPKLGERLAHVSWRCPRFRKRFRISAPDEEGRPSGHAIICGFGTLGMTIGHLLRERSIDYVVLELNPTTVERLRRKGDRVYFGDGASSELLHHSGIDQARLLAIAVPDQLNARAIVTRARKMNPDLFIIVRSRYRNQVDSFYAVGADVVVCEELEAGIEMGRYLLQELGVEPDEVHRTIDAIRAFGSADFF